MKFTGTVHKYGRDVDTDVIIPARYLNTSDPAELASHCLEDLDPEFARKVKPGDIIVAGENFGCGSSREHAPLAIKTAGVSIVIAKSFARIFYRNAINIGLPIIECAAAAQEAEEGDELSADLEAGTLTNHTKNASYKVHPYPWFIQRIIEAGGLADLVKTGGLEKE